MYSLSWLHMVNVRYLAIIAFGGWTTNGFFVISCMNDGDPVAVVRHLERRVVRKELVQMWDLGNWDFQPGFIPSLHCPIANAILTQSQQPV